MAKKQVSPGVLALRKVVDDVHKDAREAKKRGELVGWSSSKFPCELAAAFDLNVMYPENQAAGIAANRYGEMMCQAAEDLGYDNDICGYARISLAYAAGVRVARKFDPETGEILAETAGEVFRRKVDTRRILRVVTHHLGEDRSDIRGSRGHETRGIQARRESDHAETRGTAVSRLQTRDAREGRRFAD